MISLSSKLGTERSDATKLSAAVAGVSLLLLVSSLGLGQAKAPPAAEVRRYLEQGQQALKANQTELATQAYRAILEIDPANVEARANLGIVAMTQRDWAGAAEDLRTALKQQPSHWKVQALLGLCELHLGHLPEATKLLSGSFSHLQDRKLRLEAGLQLVEVWYQSGELEKSATVISQLQELYPANAAVLYAAYRVHSDLAFQAIDSLALSAPDSLQLHRALAEHMVNEGHVQEAIVEYRKALKGSPDSAGVHYELGEAFLAESHLEASLAEAQKEFESALALNPTDARSECKLGKIELFRSSAKTALDHYARALKLNPEMVCAKLGLAGMLIEEGKMQAALDYLQSAAGSDPYNAEVRHRLAVLYRSMGRSQDAEREMSAFRELEKIQSQLQKALLQAPSSN
jgi:tetratricopeptide (TPR) repeat protein